MSTVPITNILDTITGLKKKSARLFAEAKKKSRTLGGKAEAIYLLGQAQEAKDAATQLEMALIADTKVMHAGA